MPLLPILTWPDPVLRRPAAPLPEGPADAATRDLAAAMLATMYAAPGRGLAAPQVGRPVRLFVMDTCWKEGRPDPRVMINPQVLWASPEVATGPEGCLSIPGVSAQVTRPRAIRLLWRDLEGAVHEAGLDGFAATCAQHEIDHLDGIVTLDRVDAAQRAALLAAYAGGPA
jgi:peptide deformylase